MIDLRSPSLVVALAALLACSDSPPRSAGATDDASPGDAPDDPTLGDAGPMDPGGPPDLTLNLARAQVDLALRQATFGEDACELDPQEACIAAPGMRRLLHFAVETPNVGDGDMLLGTPDPSNPNFTFSQCHGHYHFEGYAEYRIIDQEGGEMAAGRKQAFCLLDTERFLSDDPTVPRSPRFRCDFQGIQRGWADVYRADLPCQFIDVTDVPDGTYTLEIELNANRTLSEKNYDNNLVSIPIELGSPDLSGPTEECPADLDDHSSAGTHRECGWTLAATFACVPGSVANIGCASSPRCGGTTCTGDPMIRVCDAEREDGNCSFPAALESAGNTVGDECPCAFNIPCPDSGQLSVYTAPTRVGEPFTCPVQINN